MNTVSQADLASYILRPYHMDTLTTNIRKLLLAGNDNLEPLVPLIICPDNCLGNWIDLTYYVFVC